MAEALLYALLLGAATGLLYDIFRFYRLIFGAAFFFDILFWIASAFASFSYFLVFTNGEIRGLYLTVIFSSFVLYMSTIGKLSYKIEKQISRKVKIRLKKVKKKLKKFKKLLQLPYNIYYNIKVKINGTVHKNYEGEAIEE